MDIICPHCQQTLEGDDSLVGEIVDCPNCGQSFVVSGTKNETEATKEPIVIVKDCGEKQIADNERDEDKGSSCESRSSDEPTITVGPSPSNGKPYTVSVSKKRTIIGTIVCLGLFFFARGCLFGNQSKVVGEIISNMILIPGGTNRICKYEVTQSQWLAIMGKSKKPFGVIRNNKGADKPVIGVSWNECQEFLEKLNSMHKVKKAGLVFRLPTYNEWDQACRAESKGELCRLKDGTEITEKTFGRVAWFKENSDGLLHPVGQLEPNAWGFYDMYGNASEWCQDAYRSSMEKGRRVVRGGDIYDNIFFCSLDYIHRWDQDKQAPGLFDAIGFRLCATDEKVVALREKEFAREREEWYAAKIADDARIAAQNEAKKRKSYLQNKENAIPDILKSMVRIRGKEFKIGNTEITQEQWESVMGIKPSDKEGLGLPVEGVTWSQCQEFLKKLNLNPQVKSAGVKFRLPTDEEVEFTFKNGLKWGDNGLWTQTIENDRPVYRGEFVREKSWYSYSGSISLRVCADCDQNDTTPFATSPKTGGFEQTPAAQSRLPWRPTNGAIGTQYR